MKKLGIVLVIAALGFGCTVHQRGFTFISTKNVELSRVDMVKTQVVRDQKGSDSRFEVSSTGWSILLFSYGSWHVKGDVGNSLSTSLPEQRQPTTVD